MKRVCFWWVVLLLVLGILLVLGWIKPILVPAFYLIPQVARLAIYLILSLIYGYILISLAMGRKIFGRF